jgi:hypothetical protein
MIPGLAKILESKRDYRRQLAARPISEKLAILDELRERELAIRQSAQPGKKPDALHDEPLPHRTK